MQITITNGTLTQVQETLSATSGYILPNSITVTGATSSYDSSTGDITLTSLTSTMSIAAEGEQSQTSGSITFGPYAIDKMYFGDSQVLSLSWGNTILYEYEPPTPTTRSGTFTCHNDFFHYDIDYYLKADGIASDSNYDYCFSNDDMRGGDYTLQVEASEYLSLCTVGFGGLSSVTNTVNCEQGTPIQDTNIINILDDNFSAKLNFYDSCFAVDTLINLADGTYKQAKDITYDDNLLVWDFHEGRLTSAKPAWIKQRTTVRHYKKVTLSNGTVLKLYGPDEKAHRLFNMTKQQCLYANECVRDEVYTLHGAATVLSCELVEEPLEICNITTEKYYDCFLQDVLSGSRLNNMYHISDMKYDSDVRLISEEEEAERWAVRAPLKL